MRKVAFASLLILLLSAGQAVANGRPGQIGGSQSAKEFVETFYRWYTALPTGSRAKDPLEVALQNKKQAFSRELFRALDMDERANAASKDGVVGLDFDPFLNSQDPAPFYSVSRVTHKGKVYFATVYGRSKDRSTHLAVTVKLERTPEGWQFENFLYPDGPNLLSVLQSLRKERAGHSSP